MSEPIGENSMQGFWTFENLAACARDGATATWASPPIDETALRCGAAIDAREIKPGQVFFALPGERVDGRSFLAQAAQNGAAMAVVSAKGLEQFEIPAGLAVLAVEDPAVSLASIAERYRRAMSGQTTVIGVTGSNGKTTTVRLIDAVMKGGHKVGTHAPKSFNNHLGLPLTLLNARPGDDYVVCEMGTSSPGEIGFLTEIAMPDVSVIVSIGRAHLEELGSVAGVAQEKAMILRTDIARFTGQTAVIPSGVPELAEALESMRRDSKLDESRMSVSTVGERGSPSRRITGVACDDQGVSFELWDLDRCLRYRVPLLGAHNAHNAAIAATVGELCGVEPEQIVAGLASAPGASMRLDRTLVPIDSGEITILNDAYNANPDSTRAGVLTLASMSLSGDVVGRRVAVLGDLLELGARSAEFHAEVVGELIEHLAGGSLDLVVLVGPCFAAAHAGVSGALAELGGGAGCLVSLPDPSDESIEAVAGLLGPGDLVLLKASRGLRLERLMDVLGRVCR
ncbi:MAG: UDP-N-acetylmuramoyl-tripeptide--D-alanyl-D-alanine ligase [Phycisphaerales bacterium]|jgi:UDP-N-acetylmuramoyl-tripeptide--D-alanyl-D-alanine ligase